MLLRTLGGLTLEGTDFSRLKPLLLLAYLAVEGARERRFIAELFWMEATDGLNRLSTALSRLRKAAPEAVGADKTRVWTTVECDAQLLLSALEAGETARALDLYRGPFLDGATLHDWGEELEEWVYGTREYLAGRVRNLLIEGAEREAALGDYPSAALQAEHAFRLSGAPELEPTQIARIHRLLLAGANPLAGELRREAEEYGVEVGTDPEEERARLRSDEGEGSGGERGKLPALGTPLVGRRSELAELVALLRDRAGSRLTTVVGPGGIGKTRLALAAASEVEAEFGQGAFFVPLAGTTSAEQVVARTSQALGLYLTTGDRREQLKRYLRDRELLLLLDDCENVAQESGLLAELLEAAPRLQILATSRERLELAVETVYALEGLDYSGTESEALQLLLQRARLVRPDYGPAPRDLRQARRICRLVQGMPLALVLAAGWFDLLSLEEIADEIERGLGFLESRMHDVPERQRSMRAVFDYSWERLSPQEREVMGKLSVFRGSFGRNAAREVAGAGLQTLRSLVHKSLLLSRQPGRYQLHGLLRQYAAEKLQGSDPQLATEERYGRYYLDLLTAANDDLLGPDQGRVVQSLGLDFDDIIGAWHVASQLNLVEPMHSALGPLHVFVVLTARYFEGLRAFREAAQKLVARGASDDDRLLVRLRVHEASMLARRGEFQGARELLEAQLPHLADEPSEHGFACEILGHFILYFQGEIDLGLERLEEALALHLRVADEYGIARNLFLKAGLLWHKGEFTRVEELLVESRRRFRELGNPQWLLSCEAGLGLVAYELGDLERAKILLEEAAGRMAELGLEHALANTHSNLGQVLMALGDAVAASRHLLLALDAFERVGDPVLWAEAHARLGQAQLMLGDTAGAEEHFRRSVVIGLEHGFEGSAGLVGLADLLAGSAPLAALGIYLFTCEHRGTPFSEKREALVRLRALRPSPEGLVEAIREVAGLDFANLARRLLGPETVSAVYGPVLVVEAAAELSPPAAEPDS